MDWTAVLAETPGAAAVLLLWLAWGQPVTRRLERIEALLERENIRTAPPPRRDSPDVRTGAD